MNATNPNKLSDTFDRIHANQCEVCGYTPEELGIDKHRYYLSGYYCSEECYDTLFDNCEVCGGKNMTVITNNRDGKGKICDKCYMEREGLVIVTITCKSK